jgi:hypothetical protein
LDALALLGGDVDIMRPWRQKAVFKAPGAHTRDQVAASTEAEQPQPDPPACTSSLSKSYISTRSREKRYEVVARPDEHIAENVVAYAPEVARHYRVVIGELPAGVAKAS